MHRIAVVDSAGGHIIEATIALEARGTPLMGAFVTIQTDTDLMLGRISEAKLTNPVHQDDAFAPTIMKSGAVPFWSGEVDIERATIEIVAVIDVKTLQRVPIRRNAPSGTVVQPAAQAAIDRFSNEPNHQLILGHIPNSGELLCSIINRHHGPAVDNDGNDLGGYGEARHLAVLGQNGSGKTVMLTMLLAGRLAAHPSMGLLMPDTSGDLADPTRHNRGDFRWNYAEALASVGVTIERISIDDIRLTSTATLKHKLSPFLRAQFNTSPEKADLLARRVVDALFDGEVNVSAITGETLIDQIIGNIGDCYERNARAGKIQDAENLRDTPHRMRRFEHDLVNIRRLFDGRFPLRDLVRDILERGRKIIVEMQQMNESDHAFVIRELMEKLTSQARRVFHSGAMCNTLIVLDEAQRWVPEGEDDEDGISNIIKAGFRETRKYGIGWIVVAQSPSGLSKKVLRECHTKWFGRNLGIGADRSHIEDILSKEGAEAYNQLQIQGGYFWVGIGLDANLGTGSSYFTLHPFGGDATRAFMDANPHIFGSARNVTQAAE